MGLILYGFRTTRGIAVYNPEDEGLPDGPLPLYNTEREAQEVIDRVNANDTLHVAEYEVQSRSPR